MPCRLLERDQALAALKAGLDDACDGRGSLLLVHGSPGIGKSRLLQAVGEFATPADPLVLRARAGELERDFAFGVARQLFEGELVRRPRGDAVLSGAAALARAVLSGRPELATIDAGDTFAAMHGLYWLAANLAAERPLVLLIDDVHWADAASLRWLDYLGRRLEGLRLLAVVATRAGEEAAELLLDGPATRLVEPGPLSPSAVRELLGRGASREAAQACHDVTGGNPFLLAELMRTLPSSGTLDAPQIKAAAPPTVARSVHRRIATTPPARDALPLAQAYAVLGQGATLTMATDLAEIPLDRAATAADALVRAEILATASPGDFIHPIVRAAVYDALPQATRSLMHARAAALLAVDPAHADEVAAHLLRAPARGDADTVERLRSSAGAAIVRGAPEAAVDLLRRALAEPPGPAVRGAVLRELGLAEALLSDPQAIPHLEESLRCEREPAGRVTSARVLSNRLALMGRTEHAVAILDDTAAAIPADARELRLLIACNRWFLTVTDADDPEPRLREAIASATPGQETVAERLVLAGLAVVSLLRSAPVPAMLALAERALGDDALLPHEASESATWVALVSTFGFSDQLERATTLYDAGLRDARRRGSAIGFAHLSALRGMFAWRQGQLATAAADATAALEVPGALPDLVVHAALAALVSSLLDRGEIEDAEALLREYGLDDAIPEGHHALWLMEARGRLRLAQGELDRAARDFELAGARYRSWKLDSPASLPWRSGLARVRARQDRLDEARALASEELDGAIAFGAPRAIALAQRALAATASGAERLALLRSAADTLARSESPLDRARVLLDLGRALREDGDAAAAREPLRPALDIAHHCGAARLVDAALTELRLTGLRPRRPAQSGLDALTPSERRTVELAASGLSNREIAQDLFLTVRTVELHLGKAYRKLGISGRAGLQGLLDGREAA